MRSCGRFNLGVPDVNRVSVDLRQNFGQMTGLVLQLHAGKYAVQYVLGVSFYVWLRTALGSVLRRLLEH